MSARNCCTVSCGVRTSGPGTFVTSMYAFLGFESLLTAVTAFAPRPLLRDLGGERLAFGCFLGSAFNSSAWLAFEGLRPGESVRCDRLRDSLLLSFEGLRCGWD